MFFYLCKYKKIYEVRSFIERAIKCYKEAGFIMKDI